MVLAGPKFVAMAALAMTTSMWVIAWWVWSVEAAVAASVSEAQSSWRMRRVEVGDLGRVVSAGEAVAGLRTQAITVVLARRR